MEQIAGDSRSIFGLVTVGKMVEIIYLRENPILLPCLTIGGPWVCLRCFLSMFASSMVITYAPTNLNLYIFFLLLLYKSFSISLFLFAPQSFKLQLTNVLSVFLHIDQININSLFNICDSKTLMFLFLILSFKHVHAYILRCEFELLPSSIADHSKSPTI